VSVSLIQCNVILSEGHWQTRPTPAAVNNILEFYFKTRLESVEFVEPEPDALLQLEVQACTGWGCGHEEAVRDRIASALLRRFRPEYESMVEVEIVVPDADYDEYDDGEDGMDETRIERMWH
jgi:hypothetical protein